MTKFIPGLDWKILAIAVIRDGNNILLRKKPTGAGPYKEPWYLFGGVVELGKKSPEDIVKEVAKLQCGIEVKNFRRFSWDTEIKPNEYGRETFYLYLDILCEYASGELKAGDGIYHIEWVSIGNLPKYEIIPPAKELFKKLQYF